MRLNFHIDGSNFDMAGQASGEVKGILVQIGISPRIVKRIAIAMYEAEINAFIHGGGGEARVDIGDGKVEIQVKDGGVGIPDLDLAMQEGWSTADEDVIRMGFGAGMGLPNIKRNTDMLEIITGPGEGTTVKMTVLLETEEGN